MEEFDMLETLMFLDSNNNDKKSSAKPTSIESVSKFIEKTRHAYNEVIEKSSPDVLLNNSMITNLTQMHKEQADKMAQENNTMITSLTQLHTEQAAKTTQENNNMIINLIQQHYAQTLKTTEETNAVINSLTQVNSAQAKQVVDVINEMKATGDKASDLHKTEISALYEQRINDQKEFFKTMNEQNIRREDNHINIAQNTSNQDFILKMATLQQTVLLEQAKQLSASASVPTASSSSSSSQVLFDHLSTVLQQTNNLHELFGSMNMFKK